MRRIGLTAVLLLTGLLGACRPSAGHGGPSIVVHKSVSCQCCSRWIEKLRSEGFRVETINTEQLAPVKERLGVPPKMTSCHTAQVAGYFIEGHVPIADITRLLKERPPAKGLTVPGMPMGSPGMESASGAIQPYDVLLVADDGRTSVYAHHGP